MKSKKAVAWWLISALYFGLLAPFAAGQTETAKPPDGAEKTEKKGLQFQVRAEKSLPDEKHETGQPAKTEKLSEAETNAILRRLPPMETE